MNSPLVTQNIPHWLAEFGTAQNFYDSGLDVTKKIGVLPLERFENPLNSWL